MTLRASQRQKQPRFASTSALLELEGILPADRHVQGRLLEAVGFSHVFVVPVAALLVELDGVISALSLQQNREEAMRLIRCAMGAPATS